MKQYISIVKLNGEMEYACMGFTVWIRHVEPL